MDWGGFRTHLLLKRSWRPITADKTFTHLQFLERDWKLDLDGFTVEAGEDVLARRIDSGATPWAVNGDVKALNALADYKLHVRPFRKLKNPRIQPKAFTPRELALLRAYRHPDEHVERRRRALINWALISAMRASEIAAMDVTDLHQEDSDFDVRAPAKRGLRRTLPAPRWVWSPRRPFGAYLAHRPAPPGDPQALWVVRDPRWYGDHAPRRASPDYLRRDCWHISRETGVRFNFVRARHHRATELMELGMHPRYIQVFLGHAVMSSTAIYLEPRPAQLTNWMRRAPTRDPYAEGDDGN